MIFRHQGCARLMLGNGTSLFCEEDLIPLLRYIRGDSTIKRNTPKRKLPLLLIAVSLIGVNVALSMFLWQTHGKRTWQVAATDASMIQL